MEIEDFMDEEWKKLLEEEFKSEYFIRIKETLKECEYLPEEEHVFEFTQKLKIDDIKVVLVGQDPYQRKGEASGLAFSAKSTYKKLPNCCRTLYRAIKKDYPEFIWPKTGCLEKWAEQGVLLLNDTLTIKEGKPGSHFCLNWSRFTNKVIEIISERLKNVVFMFLGNKARMKVKYVDLKKHFVIETVHPSHYHAEKFVNSQNFLKINEYLKKHKKDEITW